LARRNRVDPDLEDAFDDDDDSDDEVDDRQRLVRQNTTPSSTQLPAVNHASPTPQPTPVQPHVSSSSRPRVVGGGVGTDGVFANMSARPERTESEKDEQPPVESPC
jgi:hypothetical protein